MSKIIGEKNMSKKTICRAGTILAAGVLTVNLGTASQREVLAESSQWKSYSLSESEREEILYGDYDIELEDGSSLKIRLKPTEIPKAGEDAWEKDEDSESEDSESYEEEESSEDEESESSGEDSDDWSEDYEEEDSDDWEGSEDSEDDSDDWEDSYGEEEAYVDEAPVPAPQIPEDGEGTENSDYDGESVSEDAEGSEDA